MWWDSDHKLWLITPEEFMELPDGIEMECIDGEKVIKGKDNIDQDTRAGCLAYGFTIENAPLGYIKYFLDDKIRKRTIS